ncbi:hypothetical protein [Glycomyces sp. NPDC047010]|uniref:hypothetical protein n=1 Tax=Glycomyces sp. NPDC047010 TaxID=3155023 RepID=UPI0033F5DB5D
MDLLELNGLPLLVPVVTALALTVRAWIRHQSVKFKERSETERLRETLMYLRERDLDP